MSYIPCNADCTFQNDGLCNLNYATVVGMPSNNVCLHYIPRSGTLRHARWHEAPPRYSAPEAASNPFPDLDDPRALSG